MHGGAGSRRKTVIAKGLKIKGRVTAEGLVELNGQIEGELHGKSLIISRGALVKGAVSADRWLSMERSRVRSSFSSPGRM
jgi:cytoskeletal protein CcmA (bactofilin family)